MESPSFAGVFAMACIVALVLLTGLRLYLMRRKEKVLGQSGEDVILLRLRGGFRELVFVGRATELVQSRQDVRSPLRSGWGYVDGLHVGMLATESPTDVAFLGGGACIGPMQFEALYKRATIDIVENDAVVLDAARRHFGLRLSARVRASIMDARQFLTACAPGAYDVIVLDAFGAYTIPAHLVTLEFFRLVRRTLRPEGAFVANVIGNIDDPASVARRVIASIAEAFDGADVAVFRVRSADEARVELRDGVVRNLIVLVTFRTVPSCELERRASNLSANVVPHLPDVVGARWVGDVRLGRPYLDDDVAVGPRFIAVE